MALADATERIAPVGLHLAAGVNAAEEPYFVSLPR